MDHNHVVEQNKMNEELLNKPRLTMKTLHKLIIELQDENLQLSRQIEELEQQIQVFQQFRVEIATAQESPVRAELEDIPDKGTSPILTASKVQEPEVTKHWTTLGTLEETYQSFDVTFPILTPRSEKHPALKKKSFFRRS
ncbi:MAG TPA: hypothetical protein VGE40_09250 [Bacilli bacterium]